MFKNDKQRQEFKKLDRINRNTTLIKNQDEDAKNWVEVYDSGAEFYYWNKVTGDVHGLNPYILAADDQFLK